MHNMTFKTPLAIAIAVASMGMSGVASAQMTMETFSKPFVVSPQN